MSATGRLRGRRVVVTAGADKPADLARLLAAHGADVVAVPLITTEPIATAESVRAHLTLVAPGAEGPGSRGWAVFTSATAVTLVLAAAPAALTGTRLAAVGDATADRLRTAGLAVDVLPATADAAGLATALAPHVAGSRVVVFAAEGGRDVVADVLRDAGARVERLVLYRSTIPPGSLARFRAALERPVDAVTFSSGSAVRHAGRALEGRGAPPRIPAACIGHVTAVSARAAGWEEVLVSDRPNAAALTDLVVRRLGGDDPVP